MATSPYMPDQSQGASAQGGGSSASAGQDPSQQQGGGDSSASGGQANDIQMLLARWYQTAKQMAAADPRVASGMEKVAQGIQEAQTALVSPPQSTSMSQQPTY